MNSVDDGYDLLLTVVAMLMMLSICIWCVATIKSNTAVQVDEKMVAHNLYGVAAEPPSLTAKDALLALVVNDGYLPEPKKVEFKYGAQSYTVALSDAFVSNRDPYINSAWSSFFRDKMGLLVESMELSPSADRWVITLTT